MLNEDEKLLRIRRWFEGNPQPPDTLEIRPTAVCNLECISCVARGKELHEPEKERLLTKEEWVRVIDEAADLGVQRVHLSGAGGEPMMKKEASYAMMLRIKERGMQGSIVTNGMLFNDEMIRTLVENDFNYVMFSIDGADAKTHDYLRVHEGAFDICTHNMARFAYWRERLDKPGPHLCIAPVVSGPNSHQIVDFVRLAKRLGANEVLYQPITINDMDLGGHLLLTDEQKSRVKEQLPEAKRLAEELQIKTNIDFLDDLIIDKSSEINVVIEEDAKAESESHDDAQSEEQEFRDNDDHQEEKVDPLMSTPCLSPWYHMGIRPNGEVAPCGVNPPEFFGNVMDTSLKEIWEGEMFTNFRNWLSTSNLHPFCAKCCGATVMGTRETKSKLKAMA